MVFLLFRHIADATFLPIETLQYSTHFWESHTDWDLMSKISMETLACMLAKSFGENGGQNKKLSSQNTQSERKVSPLSSLPWHPKMLTSAAISGEEAEKRPSW